MGQRSQIIVLEKRVRNGKEEISIRAVYHNQWCYGAGFLSMLSDVLNAWDLALKTKKKEEYFRMPTLRDTINYCNSKEFPHLRGYYDITDEGFKDKKTIRKVFEFCDNNNGFIVLLLNGDKLSYDIVSGTEDTEKNGSITAKQYLSLFYKTDDEMIDAKIEPAEMEKILANISEAKRFNSFEIVLNGGD